MKKSGEIYISVDVETDGPIPGPHSMLSLGAAAFWPDNKEPVSTFTVNLAPLPGASPDPDTEAWWKSQPKEVYQAARVNPQASLPAIQQFLWWVEEVCSKGVLTPEAPGTAGTSPPPPSASRSAPFKPVFVGYPAGFDFLFVYWYIRKFGFKSPFSFSALDVKTFAMATLHWGLNTEQGYRDAVKKNMPSTWFEGTAKHTHRALDDAIEQGRLFLNILEVNARQGCRI